MDTKDKQKQKYVKPQMKSAAERMQMRTGSEVIIDRLDARQLQRRYELARWKLQMTYWEAMDWFIRKGWVRDATHFECIMRENDKS